MTKTFYELNLINNAYQNVIMIKPDLDKTKLGYAFHRFHEKSIAPIFEEYNTALSMVRIDGALTDKVTGELLIDRTPGGRGFRYDREGLKRVIRAEQELYAEWKDKQFEVTPFITSEETFHLTDFQKDIFQGVIIPPCKEQ